MQAQTRLIWLKIASDIVILFGLLMVLAATPFGAAPLSFLIDLIFWPMDGAQTIATETTHFQSAIAGGVTMGWGVLLYLLSARLYPQDPALTRTLITTSAITWFVTDSLGSIASGAMLNAFLNISFLALFMIPLWLPLPRHAPGGVT